MIVTYIPFLRRDASVALLALMMALKCLELRTLRDATVAICLGYFLIITNFLYSQTILTAVVHGRRDGLAHRHHGEPAGSSGLPGAGARACVPRVC